MDQKLSEFSEFREYDKSLKHEMGSILRSFLYRCLTGAVVASWSLTQEVAISNNVLKK